MRNLRYPALLFLSCLALWRCSSDPELPRAHFEDLGSHQGLKEHTREFDPEVIEVTGGVYVAIGYALANSILLEGPDGVVVVDTTESMEAGARVRNLFAKITDKPLAAIIYTHNHADHILGAAAFAEPGSVPIYAHADTEAAIDRIINMLRPVVTVRAMRMFGNFLDKNGLVNCGIGPYLAVSETSLMGVLRPTHTFRERMTIQAGGLTMELVHAPGETRDQLFVWLPDKKVLLCGDNFYKAFPNLYTIRGTPYRDPLEWVNSLDKMRELRPQFLVPSHSRPLSGQDHVFEVLTQYRDAIQYVHDQTIRGMNMGLTPQQLTERVRLPKQLAQSPYLQEYYGTVAWSVRGVFSGNLGWFDGNPTTLNPLTRRDTAIRMARLAGGEDQLKKQLEMAVSDGDHAWALELSDHLLVLNPDQSVRDLRVKALTSLGEAAWNPNARHYYLTRAAELGQNLAIGRQGRPTIEMLHDFPLDGFFGSMAVNLDPVKSATMSKKVNFVFPDKNENWSIQVRNGIAEVQPRLVENPDASITVRSDIWKEMLAGVRSPAMTLARHCNIEGGTIDMARFLSMFQPPD